MPYVLTVHALRQAARRGIPRWLIWQVLRQPEQRFRQRPGRDIFQSRVVEAGCAWLLRIVVDVDRDPAEVVTVYRTSSVGRYWKGAP